MCKVGAEDGRFAKINVVDGVLGEVRIPMNEDADAAGQAVRDGDFLEAHERDMAPAQLAGGLSGVGSVEVGGHGKEDTGDVVGDEGRVGLENFGEQGFGRVENGLRAVDFCGDGSAYASCGHDSLRWRPDRFFRIRLSLEAFSETCQV